MLAKREKILIIVLTLLVAASFVMIKNNKREVVKPPAVTVSPTPNPFLNAKPNLSAKVNITSRGLNPQTLVVMKGSIITFTNEDNKNHELVADNTKGNKLEDFESGILATKQSYGYTFEETGTFYYTDKLNPTVYQGVVIVK